SGRVAVVVVAGVGDNPRSDAAERIVNGLTARGFPAPEEHSEWFMVPGDRIRPVQRFETRTPGGTPVDVYEFWWADLSRFPRALRRARERRAVDRALARRHRLGARRLPAPHPLARGRRRHPRDDARAPARLVRERTDERRARTISAILTLGFGPLGIATLMA